MASAVRSRRRCSHDPGSFREFWCDVLLDEDIEAGDEYVTGFRQIAQVDAVRTRVFNGD